MVEVVANNEDLVVKSKSKSSFNSKSEFSNSFAANMSDGSNKLDDSCDGLLDEELLIL
jgi:hypothetical protein